jgi:secreted trypsin-like serine protease
VLGQPQGGPLEPFVQVGIVSFGPNPASTGQGCASEFYPGVYTRVSSVATWVRSTVCTRVGELCDDNQPSQRPMNRPTMRPNAGGSKAGKATTMPIVSKSGKVGNSAKSRKN